MVPVGFSYFSEDSKLLGIFSLPERVKMRGIPDELRALSVDSVNDEGRVGRVGRVTGGGAGALMTGGC